MRNKEVFVLPAEWMQQDAVLMAWPHKDTDWQYMLDEAQDCFCRIITAISQVAKVIVVAPVPDEVMQMLPNYPDCGEVYVLQCYTNDTWARDFGPLIAQACDGSLSFNDFKFNGWGLKFASDKDNLISRQLYDSPLISGNIKYVNRLNFVLEGGSIDVDGDANVLTTEECMLSPNRNGAWSKEEVEEHLLQALGCRKCFWLKNGYLAGDDTDSHVDTLARFLPGEKIAYSACDRQDDEHYQALKHMEEELEALRNNEGQKYQLVPLCIPEAIFDEDGRRLPATYANFLILNGTLFLPVYSDGKYDAMAIEQLKEALPDYKIVSIECTPLIQQHGSLHCVTMQLPQGVFAPI